MKRLSFIISALMVAALLLAACGGGGAQEQTPGTGVGTEVPGLATLPADTGTTGLGTGTPEVGLGAGTPTVETTETAPADDMTGTATAPAGDAVSGTPTVAAGTGGDTGAVASSQFVLLSELVAMPVNDQSGTQIGSVNGVVVDSTSAGSTSGMDSETPVATSDVAGTTQTPAATVAATESTTDSGTGVAMGSNPTISYVVVNVTGGASMGDTTGTDSTPEATTDASGAGATQTPAAGTDLSGTVGTSNQVLVPWQAFTFSGSSTASVPSTDSASDSASTDATQTPAASMADVAGTPTVSSDMGSGSDSTITSTSAGTLTLNVDQSALASAPAFDASAFAGTVGPDVAQYWSGQGLSIPATGAPSTAGGTFLLQSPLTGLEIMDSGSQSLGQVQDFVVDTTTGELVYAILAGSDASSSGLYIVPMTSFSWQAGTGSSTMGEFQANFASDAFTSAPSITSLSELDLSSPDWQSEYDSYWNTVK